jgi:hypothetical protein
LILLVTIITIGVVVYKSQVLLRPGLHLTVDQDPPVTPTVDGMAVLELYRFEDHADVTEDIVREILIGRADYDDQITRFH